MKNILLILLVAFSSCCNKKINSTQQLYTLKGKITQTSSYCGGAAPNREILDQLAQPKAFVGKKLFLREGNINSEKGKIIAKIVADSSGNFNISVPAGIYSIIVEEQEKVMDAKKYTSEFVKANEVCLKEWWTKPLQVIEIKDNNIENLDFNFHHKCRVKFDIPCLEYFGPLPD